MSTQLSIYATSKKTGEKTMLAWFSTTPARYMDQSFNFVYETETPISAEDISKLAGIYEKDLSESKNSALGSLADESTETMLLMNAKSMEIHNGLQERIGSIHEELEGKLEDIEDAAVELGRLYCVYNFLDDHKDQFDFSYTYC